MIRRKQPKTQYRHSELIGIAVDYCMAHGYVLAVTECAANTFGGQSEIPDVLAVAADGRTLAIECKASRADFLADAQKPHRLLPSAGLLKTYFVAPGVLTTADEARIQLGWGAIEVQPDGKASTVLGAYEVQGKHAAKVDAAILVSALRRVCACGSNGERGLSVKVYKWPTESRTTVTYNNNQDANVEDSTDETREAPKVAGTTPAAGTGSPEK